MNYTTRQRTAVLNALRNVARPMTASEIQDVAGAYSPGLGIATVYRSLRFLMDAGDVDIIKIPGASPHYGLKSAANHHFLCEKCRRIRRIDGDIPGISQMAPPGFTVNRTALTLYGTCDKPECAL